MREAFRLGAKQAAQLIERSELRAEALITSCRERIADREPVIKAWTHLAAEWPAAKAPPAPLFGVPVGAKDIFDTHDMPTQYGSPIYAGYRPRTDAAAVALTRRAGGTIMGKTVTAEFATFVPRQTRNPLDPSRTPGGSSSGSAAAVADLMVPLAFGTQTAGSLIRPASYCGIFAFKPTYNVLPRAGLKPGADSLDTVGVYARSVEDLAFFAAALTQRTDLEAKLERPPRIGEALGPYDVLLAPAATGEAPQGLSSTGDVAMNVVWTLLHTPCVAVPAGKSEHGMPLGLQVVGRIGDDARTLAAAAWIAERLA